MYISKKGKKKWETCKPSSMVVTRRYIIYIYVSKKIKKNGKNVSHHQGLLTEDMCTKSVKYKTRNFCRFWYYITY
jgi:hypothetical protein